VLKLLHMHVSEVRTHFDSLSPGFIASQNSHISSIIFFCSGLSGKLRPTFLSTSGDAMTAKISCDGGGGGGGGETSFPMPR
jgi:hypothetical protein